MKSALRWMAIFGASLVAAKLIEIFLTSQPGKKLLERTGSTALLSDEGMGLVRKYAKDATGVVLGTLVNHRVHGNSELVRAGWVDVIDNAAEIMSTTGSLLRMATEFWDERQELYKHFRARY
ncbi:MAG: hypothetical protein HYY30_01245 [Chloroflexi bacterium]|nr:hypothetical protein [Chloroflexota bacterium]